MKKVNWIICGMSIAFCVLTGDAFASTTSLKEQSTAQRTGSGKAVTAKSRREDLAYIAGLRDKLEETRKELVFRRARNDIRYAPQKGDGVRTLWGKMLKLMACGTDEGAIRCLEAYAAAAATIDEEGEREKFVPAVRQFILERKGRKIDGGVVVMRYAPPATSHKTFNIGDIVVAVNDERNVSVDGYVRVKKATDGNCVLEILRYDAASETFRELKVPLAKGQCPVMMCDLAE